MRRRIIALNIALVLSTLLIAQKRPQWKGGYLQKLTANPSEVEFVLMDDEIIDSILIQKFGNHKWSQVAMIQNKKIQGSSNYKASVFWNQGENKFRLKYFVMDTIYYSEQETYECNRDPITYEIIKKDRKTQVLQLSAFAEFSIWSALGALMAKTSGESYDISSLDQGVYYLLIDGRTEKFLKK